MIRADSLLDLPAELAARFRLGDPSLLVVDVEENWIDVFLVEALGDVPEGGIPDNHPPIPTVCLGIALTQAFRAAHGHVFDMTWAHPENLQLVNGPPCWEQQGYNPRSNRLTT